VVEGVVGGWTRGVCVGGWWTIGGKWGLFSLSEALLILLTGLGGEGTLA
jgi:hypothetical protein